MKKALILWLLSFLLLFCCCSETQIEQEPPPGPTPEEDHMNIPEPEPEPEPEPKPEPEPEPPVTSLSWAELGGDLGKLQEYPALVSLDLRGCNPDAAALVTALSPLAGLRELDLREAELTAEEFDALQAALPACSIRWDVPAFGMRLDSFTEELDLGDIEEKDTELLAVLDRFPKLRTADLRSWTLTDEEMDALYESHPTVRLLFRFSLAGLETDSTAVSLDLKGRWVRDRDLFRRQLRYLPELTYLDMCNSGFKNEQMAELREEFPQVKFVWMLQMGQYRLRTDAKAFSTLVGFDDYTRLSSRSIQVLQYCTDLEALDLGHHDIRDISILYQLPNLRVLILADNKITDITPIGSLKELRYLEIFMNYNIKDISPLANLDKLVDLNMSYLAKIQDYSPLYGLEHLERLWLNHCDLYPEFVEELKTHLAPGCEVSASWVHGSTDNGWRKHPRHKMQYDMFHHNYIDPWFYENP